MKKKSYKKLHETWVEKESYQAPITMPYPEWADYVAEGKNTLYGDAIVPSGTTDDGAVVVGHVRQNPFTAGAGYPYPYT